MNLKEKFRTKSFWLAVAGAIVFLLQTLGVKADAPFINEIIGTFCAALVMLGVMSGGGGGDDTAAEPVSEEKEE